MKIYVVRHGETEANKEGRMQGSSDYPLNEFGIALARETGRGMRDIHFDRCISSPLTRAYQTAQIILEESGNRGLPIETDDRIKEIHMGSWEGIVLRKEGGDPTAEAVRNFMHSPFLCPVSPDGETARQVCRRTQEFLRELTAVDDGKTVLVTMHGFALRSMLNMFYDNPADFWHGHVPYNCAVNVIVADRDGLRLEGEEYVYYDSSECVDRYAGS